MFENSPKKSHFFEFFFLFRLVFLKTKNETFLRTFLPTVCLSSHLILSKNTVQNCVEILPSNISPPVCSKIGFQNQKHLSKAFEKNIVQKSTEIQTERHFFVLWMNVVKKEKKMPFFPYLPFSSPKYISQSFI